MHSELTVGNHIGGKETPAIAGGVREKIAPATGMPLATVADSTAADMELAVSMARRAQREWARASVLERKAALLAWAARLRGIADQIAVLDARDSGSPISHGRRGLLNGIAHLEHFAGLGYELTGESIPATPGNLHLTIREPYGVVGILTPFNHPSFFPVKLSAPALAAGNAVVVKPSELAPLSATLVAEAATGVLPDGLINVVHGGPQVGQALVQHPDVLRLHLTGGVATGLAIQEAAARSGRVKMVTLELGGKNPLIIFPDIDPVLAAATAVRGMNFDHQGQSCGSTSRVFVHQSIAAEVTERIVDQVARIPLGEPELEDTQMGSLISQAHQQRVLAMVESARKEGAHVATGGQAPGGRFTKGAYVEPTVLTEVKPEMAIARTEVFGPVLSVIEWKDEEEVLDAVNGTEYGLTAAVFCRDIDRALRTALRVESGYVWVNGIERRWLGMPFGGYKNSGIGHEHARETMLSYTRQKSLNVIINPV